MPMPNDEWPVLTEEIMDDPDLLGEYFTKQDELYKREAATKVGWMPWLPYHRHRNPTEEEHVKQQAEREEWAIQAKARKLSPSQTCYYERAQTLIADGKISSFQDLANRCDNLSIWSYPRKKHTPQWAFNLVKKMIVRGTFTMQQIDELIADTTSPYINRPRKPRTKKEKETNQ